MADLFRIRAGIGTGGTGMVTLNPQVPDGLYEVGDLVTVSVIPDAGFSFVEWTEFGLEFISATSSFVYTVPTKDTYLLANLTGASDPLYDYGLKYFFQYKVPRFNSDTRLEIWAKGWAGVALERLISNIEYRFGVKNSDIFETVIGTSVDFNIPAYESVEYNEFLNSDPRFFQVKYYRNYGLINEWGWTGYLKTDFSERPFKGMPYDLSLTATDILKTLDVYNFPREFLANRPAIFSIAGILGQTVKNRLPISVGVNVFETRMDSTIGLFEQFSVNSSRFFNEGEDFFYNYFGVKLDDSVNLKVALEYLLNPFLCRIFQWNNRYYIVRINELLKNDMKFFNYTGAGIFEDITTIDNTQVMPCLYKDGVLRGELSYNRFYAKLILGVIGSPERNTVINDFFTGFTRVGRALVYKLKNWQYVNTVPFDGVRNSETARLELVQEPNRAAGALPQLSAMFWGTANGVADTNLSYIELNSYTQGTSTLLAIETANKVNIKAEFVNLRRGSADKLIPTFGSQLVAIQVQVGASYLYEVSANVYDWTLTPSICTFPIINNNVVNTLEITDVVVPENGEVKVRLCQVITVSGTRHRYLVAWKSIQVAINKNDDLQNTEILKIGEVSTDFPNKYPEYETYIGDSLTNMSVSAIKLTELADDPVSELWSRDAVEEIPLLDYLIKEMADLYGKNNYRFWGDYYDMLNPTLQVSLEGDIYLLNSFSYQDHIGVSNLDMFLMQKAIELTYTFNWELIEEEAGVFVDANAIILVNGIEIASSYGNASGSFEVQLNDLVTINYFYLSTYGISAGVTNPRLQLTVDSILVQDNVIIEAETQDRNYSITITNEITDVLIKGYGEI